MDTREKILSREGLHAVLEEHRRADRKIVIANGVFDLLHVGHVRYLKAAKAEGDILVHAGLAAPARFGTALSIGVVVSKRSPPTRAL